MEKRHLIQRDILTMSMLSSRQVALTICCIVSIKDAGHGQNISAHLQ